MMSQGPWARLSFQVSQIDGLPCFGPRLGRVSLRRVSSEFKSIEIDTPGLMSTTSRGVVPHLSRDHYLATDAIQWVNVPFETFVEQTPPVPTLQTGSDPIHNFLGFAPSKHILSMSVRDPSDGRQMPSNGKDHVSVHCVRGVRKVTPSAWRSYIDSCKPDVVVALSDTCLTSPPYSQKRLTKSNERSIAWLADILQPVDSADTASPSNSHTSHPLNVLVHMAGDISVPARKAFSSSLLENLYGKEAELVRPLAYLDEGVAGYSFDLVPLRISLAVDQTKSIPPPVHVFEPFTSGPERTVDTSSFVPLFEASLAALPQSKLRVVNSVISPHEILRLVRDIGIDLFDARWAQRAADIGVALDFQFPVNSNSIDNAAVHGPRIHKNGKRDLGHNLYNPVYAHSFTRLASCFLAGSDASDSNKQNMSVCRCAACSPIQPRTQIAHSNLDSKSLTDSDSPSSIQYLPPFTRAYLHHLLHTHEMSSHSLLAMHNLTVVEAFFRGIRSVFALPDGTLKLRNEIQKFVDMYDDGMALHDEAIRDWTEVELARGKGRLAREKAKQTESTLGTAVEI